MGAACALLAGASQPGGARAFGCASAGADGSPRSATACSALGALFHDTRGEAWVNKAGWASAAAAAAATDAAPGAAGGCGSGPPPDYCAFWGVTCAEGVSSGEVTAISLPSNGLLGTLPAAVADLASLQARRGPSARHPAQPCAVRRPDALPAATASRTWLQVRRGPPAALTRGHRRRCVGRAAP